MVERPAEPGARSKIEEVRDWVRTHVSRNRFRHIQGVVRAAKVLAKKEGLSALDAELAAWLHDCAKELPKREMLDLIRGTPFRLDSEEREMPGLWHPHAGAALAFRKWGVRKASVLEAVRRHTLGAPGMGALAQVLFVADFIEPGRDFPNVSSARKAASRSLEEGVLIKASMTLQHLLKKGLGVHPRLIETWNYFLKERAS